MSDDELDEFLGRGGTGVLSFATSDDGPPVSLPVSYGYDANASQFYFRLSVHEGSRKRDLFDRPVSLVVHEETDDGWRSVVADGRLEEVTDAPYDSTAVQGMWTVRIPSVEIFDRPREDVTFREFRLRPDSFSGRKEFRD